MPAMRLAAIAVLTAAPLLAQSAGISGSIGDSSGLAVPGARLTVQSVGTGAVRAVSSNQQGEYSVPALAPGAYDITIEAAGFKAFHQTGIVLEVDQRATLNFTLTVGNASESVTVEGTAPLVNTSDASVSTVIGNQFVENLPLNGRSFSSLIELAPGVVLTPANYYEQGQFSVNGQRPDANYFTVDGVSANLGTAGFGSKPDGIYYRSRHDPARMASALFDHCEASVAVAETLGAWAHQPALLGEILDHYAFGTDL
jgi:hypothetical protein